MVGKEVMCVTWNTHHNVLMSVFDGLLKSQTLVDCTLAAEGRSIKAHKVIISACSPYLKSLLSGASETHPILILNDTKYSELVSLVEYMYKGAVELPQGKVEGFVRVAEALQISGVSGGEGDGENADETPSLPVKGPSLGGKSMRRRRGLDEEGGRIEKRARVSLEGEPSSRSPSLTPASAPLVRPKMEVISEPEAQSSDGGNDWEPQPGSSRDDEDDDGDDGVEVGASRNSIESNDEEVVGMVEEEEEEEEKITLIVIPEESDPVPESQRHPCPQCGSECRDIQALRRHLKRHSRDARDFPFRCDTCQTPFKLQRTLDVHKEWECGKEPSFECSICGKRFHLERYLKQHERKHFGRAPPEVPLPPHICFDCGRLFKHRAQLDAHHRWECGKEPSFECEVCGDKFHYKVYLNEHKLATHTEASLELGPLEPGAITLSQDHSTGDDLLPPGSGGYRCELCPRSFTRIGSLNYHVSRKHSGKALEVQRDPQLYPFSCPRCGNRYRNSTQLSRHRKWECGKGPMFQCTLCIKRFHHRHGLKQHLRLHAVGGGMGGRRRGSVHQMQFCCDKCGKGYKLKSSLNNHARWECGKEPVFACNICFVRFSHKGNLKKHILTKHIKSPDDLTVNVDNLLVPAQP